MARLHVWVQGHVQGVFFRDATQRVARDLGLAGWVRNIPDGRVEAVFEGDRDICARALAFVRVGPPSAHVESVAERWDEAEQDFEGFQITY